MIYLILFVLTALVGCSKETQQQRSERFLVDNMEYKYSISGSGSDVLDTLSKIDDPYGWDPYLSTVAHYLDSMNGQHRPRRLIKTDLTTVGKEYLCRNIESALSVWSSSPWRVDYSFDDFLRWVLPYRAGHEELEDWRALALGCYMLPDSVKSRDMITIAKAVLDSTGVWYNIGMSSYPYPLRFSDIKRVGRGSCEHQALAALFMMRANGIPSAMDCTPVWANRSSNHVWNVVVLPNGKSHHFASFVYKLSKVYRQSFEILRNDPLYKYRDTEEIPTFFSEFNMLDVTDQYDMPLSTIKVDNLKKSDSKLVWLCTFDNHKWVPVAYSEESRGKAVFENVARGILPDDNKSIDYINVGRGIVYLPAYYQNRTVIPASDPVIVEENGNIRTLTPDTINKQALTLGRKYPKHPHFDQYEKEMIGGRFEVADRTDFRDAQTLFTITRQQRYPLEQHQLPLTTAKYRYVRYVLRDSCTGNIAELKFYNGKDELRGEPIGIEGDIVERGAKAVFDDNMESYYYCNGKSKTVWVGLDLGKPTQISSLAFTARTDDNEICLGDTYQLLYWHDGWRQTKPVVAESHLLIYNSVPSNTLYLLKNLSRGVEHRPFTYDNDTQVWW